MKHRFLYPAISFVRRTVPTKIRLLWCISPRCRAIKENNNTKEKTGNENCARRISPEQKRRFLFIFILHVPSYLERRLAKRKKKMRSAADDNDSVHFSLFLTCQQPFKLNGPRKLSLWKWRTPSEELLMGIAIMKHPDPFVIPVFYPLFHIMYKMKRA